MKKKVIVFFHYLVIVLAISLPFWLSWKTVAIIMLAYHLMFTRGLGYCPLTVWQFGTAEEGFIEKHKTFIRYGLPLLLVTAALVRQVVGL